MQLTSTRLSPTVLIITTLLTVAAGCSPRRQNPTIPTPQPAPAVATPRAAAAADWVLPIPARAQWENGHGYCGETSVQAIGLYYGAWISQGLVRQLGGGEILLGDNLDQALDALHFTYEEWDSSGGYKKFMTWLKGSLAQAQPVIFAAFVADADNSGYDHIMPAVGVRAHNSNPDVYDARDELVYATNFNEDLLTRPFSSLAATASSVATIRCTAAVFRKTKTTVSLSPGSSTRTT